MCVTILTTKVVEGRERASASRGKQKLDLSLSLSPTLFFPLFFRNIFSYTKQGACALFEIQVYRKSKAVI